MRGRKERKDIGDKDSDKEEIVEIKTKHSRERQKYQRKRDRVKISDEGKRMMKRIYSETDRQTDK